MKQALSALLARLGAMAGRSILVRMDGLERALDRTAERLDAIEASLGALHHAVQDLAAIPSLSTELVDGIAEAEARAAARLSEVERLLAGR